MRHRAYTRLLLVAMILCAAVLSGCEMGAPKGKVPAGVTHKFGRSLEVVGYLAPSPTGPEALIVYATSPATRGAEPPRVLALVRSDGLDMNRVKADVVGRYVWIAGRVDGKAEDGTPIVISEAMELVEEP